MEMAKMPPRICFKIDKLLFQFCLQTTPPRTFLSHSFCAPHLPVFPRRF